MGDYHNHHATVFVAPEVAGPIEAARRNWDPDMAARIAAHVTVAYPHEAPISFELLLRRLYRPTGVPPAPSRQGRR
jgi:hypothetical protein